MLHIIISPAYVEGKRLHGRFVTTLAGHQLCTYREPLLGAARFLLAEGVPIAARHAAADFDAMMSTVGGAACLTVSDGNTRSATFAPYKVFSRADVKARVRFDERPPPDTGQGVKRTCYRRDDLGETPDVATLAPLLAGPFPRTIWESACGHGARAQRRLMQKLADHVDRVTRSDCLFFERFPHRQHSVRLASIFIDGIAVFWRAVQADPIRDFQSRSQVSGAGRVRRHPSARRARASAPCHSRHHHAAHGRSDDSGDGPSLNIVSLWRARQ